MKSIVGLAGLLHLYQDSFAAGHANLHIYNGSVDLDHLRGDLSPSSMGAKQLIDASTKIIRNDAANCQCIISK